MQFFIQNEIGAMQSFIFCELEWRHKHIENVALKQFKVSEKDSVG